MGKRGSLGSRFLALPLHGRGEGPTIPCPGLAAGPEPNRKLPLCGMAPASGGRMLQNRPWTQNQLTAEDQNCRFGLADFQEPCVREKFLALPLDSSIILAPGQPPHFSLLNLA
jgi:hypothetical protein